MKIQLLFILLFLQLFSISCSDENEIPKVPEIPETSSSEDTIQWKNRLPSTYHLIKDSIGSDGKGHTFFVESEKVFIDQQLSNSIFLGAILNKDTKLRTPLQLITKYECNETIISSSIVESEISEDYIPSMPNYKLIIESYKNTVRGQNISSSYSEDNKFNSYKELFFMFSNYRVPMDSIISGKRYWKTKMKKSNGIAFISESVHFRVDLEFIGEFVKNQDTYFTKETVFVGGVSFGSVKLLIGESDEKDATFKSIIKKVAQNQNLSAGENKILNESELCIVNPSTNEVNRNTNKLELIKSFYKNDSEISYPIWVQLFDQNNRIFDFKDIIHLPN